MITTILNNILVLLGTSTGVAILLSQNWYNEILLNYDIDIKPINCALCLTLWISLIFLLIHTTPFFIALAAAFINSYIGEVLYRKINFM